MVRAAPFERCPQSVVVMPGLAAGIHEFPGKLSKSWTAGTSPAMTRIDFYRNPSKDMARFA
jgi:hypothetical protein